jgi:hypothetical protein
MRLFGAGAVLYGAHMLFLRYYAREWAGMQFAGVNGCAGEEMIADGDLLEGQTYCNKVINFVPWVELYRRHWQAATLYYGVVLAAILLAGLVVLWMQWRLAPTSPFGSGGKALSPAESEHLR